MSKRAISYQHIPALDGVRGIAVLMVIACHSVQFSTEALTPVGSLSQFGKALVAALACGWVGVDLFFVLSGFLITNILLISKDQEGYFRNFYAKRALRIFPLYYMAIALFLFVIPQVSKSLYGPAQSMPIDATIFCLYLQNFLHQFGQRDPVHQVLNPTWSLAVEEHFYMLWPAFIYYFEERKIAKATVMIVTSVVLIRTGFCWRGMPALFPSWTFWTIMRIDSLCIGALLAVLHRNKSGAAILDHYKWYALAVSATSTALTYHPKFKAAFGFTCYALLFASILNVLIAKGGRSPFFENFLLRAVGKYSYCMYLFHVPITLAIIKVYAPHDIWEILALLGLELTLSFLFAWVSWHVFEKHSLKLKKYFSGTLPSTTAASKKPSRLPA